MTKAEYKELKEVPDPYFGGAKGFEKVATVALTASCCLATGDYQHQHDLLFPQCMPLYLDDL